METKMTLSQLKKICILYCISLLIFFITVPAHELVHYLLAYLPGTQPIAFHFFDSVAFSHFSIASVSIEVLDENAVTFQSYWISELIAFLVQFICVVFIMWKVIMPHPWFRLLLDGRGVNKKQACP